MDEELKQYLDEMKRELRSGMDRAAEAFATELSASRTETRESFDEVNRRLRRVDTNTNATAEMLVRQLRVEKLEGGPGKAA